MINNFGVFTPPLKYPLVGSMRLPFTFKPTSSQICLIGLNIAATKYNNKMKKINRKKPNNIKINDKNYSENSI